MYQREPLTSCASPGAYPGHGLVTRRHDAPEFDVAMSVEPSATNPVGPDIASTCGGTLDDPSDKDGMTVSLDGVSDPSGKTPSRVTQGSDPLGQRSTLTMTRP